MRKHTPKPQSSLIVTGKMSQKQAGQVGLKLANAALITAIARACVAMTTLLAALYLWFR